MISPASGSGEGERRGPPFILALGSNLGDRRAHLVRGLEFLARHLAIDAVSRVVDSPAWGPVHRQPDFLNLVVRGSTDRDALGLLGVAQETEAAAGRIRVVRQGPRTLDVDLIFFGALRIRSARLRLPHPHWAERPFVSRLIPEVAGDMVDPDSGRLLRELSWDDPLPGGMRVVAPLSAFSEVGGSTR